MPATFLVGALLAPGAFLGTVRGMSARLSWHGMKGIGGGDGRGGAWGHGLGLCESRTPKAVGPARLRRVGGSFGKQQSGAEMGSCLT